MKAAKVSEISEATAASAIPAEERVNFHIGNPVQDERLTQSFFRIALGEEAGTLPTAEQSSDDVVERLEAGGWPRKSLEFLLRLIRKSAPYMPRGGYQRNAPNELILRFHEWLRTGQPDPLAYDLGGKSGTREIILAAGGLLETFRVFLHAVSNYLVDGPARFYCYGVVLPDHFRSVDRCVIVDLPASESAALEMFRNEIATTRDGSVFLVLGNVTREETRRAIRHMSMNHPIVIVEMNDAPNSASLAREARMSQRVLRFLTPGVLSPRLAGLPTVFVAGNADFISILEVAHFQLKGTPSAPEVEHLGLLLDHPGNQEDSATPPSEFRESDDALPLAPGHDNPLASAARRAEGALTEIAERRSGAVERTLDRIIRQSSLLAKSSTARVTRALPPFEPFAGTPYEEVFQGLVEQGSDPEWQSDVRQAFLTAFLKHHPEYKHDACFVVSGSSRTALGLLGFHCGIREVITADLSWTYEHCFPRVTAIPLAMGYELDTDALLAAVDRKQRDDPEWASYGAVALNNPHNATGQAFRESDLRRLLRELLDRRITVIDDLAYQHVAPSNTLQGPPTLRQMADRLVREGSLSDDRARSLITVHSVSKTDCLAGSRLAVVEIRMPELAERFSRVNDAITPNVAALFLSYLFYRAPIEQVREYWLLRNRIFEERMSALEDAVRNLPAERNRFNITIRRPTGSMYPLMEIERLPSGLSLDWLSSGLARQGIGLLPLSAFARTETGFEAGRKVFRLTLGGTDTAPTLLAKTRRVLIDLNRMMAEEESKYNRRSVRAISRSAVDASDVQACLRRAEMLIHEVKSRSRPTSFQRFKISERESSILSEHIAERLAGFQRRLSDRLALLSQAFERLSQDDGRSLASELGAELYKDSLEERQRRFRRRLGDRTVHPTQMYSLRVESLFEEAIQALLRSEETPTELPHSLSSALVDEFLGLNVAIPSSDEGNELLLDIQALLAAEDVIRQDGTTDFRPFLSYWGDWDGSTRPSGQGHHLVAMVLIENLRRQARLFRELQRVDSGFAADQGLADEVRGLERNVGRFQRLLNEITLLTHQLERRYKGLLPFQLAPSRLRRIGMALKLASDPLTTLWEHNDRLERRMVHLREKRKGALEYYFRLNKALRKALHAAVPQIIAGLRDPQLCLEAVTYRDLLKRIVITPRIHQKMVTAQDQFAIDTTVHNITEINEIAGAFGNPGMILALQISMSTSSDALIALDRKLRSHREEALRHNSAAGLAPVWLIPLFEDLDAVKDLKSYLGKVWEHALQSRKLNQSTHERFTEILPELFIAGSDLSQQVGQTAGSSLFKQAKREIVTWLAERGLVGEVRIKMGSGEPMQRQGGYYAPVSGLPAFHTAGANAGRLASRLPASAKKSVEFATTPLMGVFAAGDLRTFQSNLSEQLRLLPVEEYAQLLLHVYESQRFHEGALIRAAEPLVDTRLQFAARGLQELERLTVGSEDKIYGEFVRLTIENFRHILYGRQEDVVGIHILSYFIARSTPPLRDRPTFRPGRGLAETQGHQILERIAGTVPLSRYGSLLRAIAHNQAQTTVLGINQLTTGLFRSFHHFSAQQFPEGTGSFLLAERVMPHLPVYEILHTLRIYQDVELKHLRSLEGAFPAGNSAFTALREDADAMGPFLGALRKELLRRHGLSVATFFEGDHFHPDLLPTLRPDLAVLLQPDLFNTDPESLFAAIRGPLRETWKESMERLLRVPREIATWRGRAWRLLLEPVQSRVHSFVELALALASLSDPTALRMSDSSVQTLPRQQRVQRTTVAGSGGDSVEQFIAAAHEYLTGLSRQYLEVPTTVVRALKEVERIRKIDEQGLSAAEQDELRFCLLQIARLAGENG